MPPKLTKASEAIKTLIPWFQSGKLTTKHKPSEVQKSHDLFKQYKPSTFRTRYNEIKREFCRDRDIPQEEDEEELDRMCTSSAKKRKLFETAVESEGEGDERQDHIGGEELLTGDLFFKPIYLLYSRKDPHTKTKRVSIAAVLPSRISVGDFSLRVVDSGQFLELTVTWPPLLLQMSILHKKWLADERDGFALYHPKVVGFEQALRELRSRTSEKIESVARLPLPFAVQTTIENKYNLAWKDYSVRMVNVELKAIVENYALTNDCQAFEVL